MEAATRTIVSSTPIDQKCMDCGTQYAASKVVYSDDHENITPKRCEICQTRHLTNLRVDKALTAHRHIGNLKSRLSKAQCDAVIEALTDSLNTVYEQFAGTIAVKSGFDIGKVKETVLTKA